MQKLDSCQLNLVLNLSKNILKANQNDEAVEGVAQFLGFKLVKKHFESKSQHRITESTVPLSWF